MDAEYIKRSSKHVDIIFYDIRTMVHLTICFKYSTCVHQDTSNRTLTRLEKMNRKMDIMDKSIVIQKTVEENAQRIVPTLLGISTII